MPPRRILIAALCAPLLAAAPGSSAPPASGPAPAPAPSAQPPRLPASMATKSQINVFLELHSYLMSGARNMAKVAPAYQSELESYQIADTSIREPRVRQLIYDALIDGQDMAAIQKSGASIVSQYVFGDHDGAQLIFKALDSAWPKWEAKEMVQFRIGLQQLWIGILENIFEDRVAPRVLPKLYEKMGFVPLDAPITLYPVISAFEQGAWGRTTKGYYMLIPAAHRAEYAVVESIIHEMTHVIEGRQPDPDATVVGKLRKKAVAADPQTLESLIHGLVVWNSGEMLRRYVRPDWQPYEQLSLDSKAQIARFRLVYSGAWNDYLDGKITADAVVAALAKTAASPPPEPVPPADKAKPAAGS